MFWESIFSLKFFFSSVVSGILAYLSYLTATSLRNSNDSTDVWVKLCAIGFLSFLALTIVLTLPVSLLGIPFACIGIKTTSKGLRLINRRFSQYGNYLPIREFQKRITSLSKAVDPNLLELLKKFRDNELRKIVSAKMFLEKRRDFLEKMIKNFKEKGYPPEQIQVLDEKLALTVSKLNSCQTTINGFIGYIDLILLEHEEGQHLAVNTIGNAEKYLGDMKTAYEAEIKLLSEVSHEMKELTGEISHSYNPDAEVKVSKLNLPGDD